jgi:tripartite-type tricarboxylate transporter receptor subunit TctC
MHRRALIAGLPALPGLARAQGSLGDWPNRPVRVINPFPPGGPGDTYARLLSAHFAERFGQPFIVENRAGGTGAVGTLAVMRSPPDGHALLFTSISGYSLPPLLLQQPVFDPQRDFAPVSLLIRYPFYLVANPRFASVRQLVEAAKARPGTMNFSSVGTGSGGHFCAERFRLKAGIEVQHVPYNGAPAALMGVASGQVDYYFDSVGNAQPLVKDGKISGLAITGDRRMPIVPDVPTMAEAGFPGFEADLWLGLLAPLGTPAPVIAALNAECDRFLALPATRERLHTAAYNPAGGPPEVFARRIREDAEEWGEVVRLAQMRMQ